MSKEQVNGHFLALPLNDIRERLYAQQVELPLRVLLLENKIIPWYYENFVNIFLYKDHFQYVSFDFQFLGYSQDLFHYYRMNLDTEERKGAVAYLIKRLDEQFYAYLKVDPYYLPYSQWHQREHSYHDLLIYGYDLEKKMFQALYFDDAGKLLPREVSFADIAEAIYNIPDKGNPDEGYDITVFKPRHFYWEYPFSLERFLNSLYDYLESTDKNEESYFTCRLRESLQNKYVFGINGIQCILDQYHTTGQFDFMMLHFQYEHKKGLMNSFRYIMDKYNLQQGTKVVLNNFKNIVSNYQQLRMLYLKCSALFDEGKRKSILARMATLLEVTIQNERVLLSQIYTVLYEFNKSNSNKRKFKDVSSEAERQAAEPTYPQGFQWLQNQFMYNYAIRYNWIQPKRIHTIELETSACAVVTLSSGHIHLFNHPNHPGAVCHKLTLDPQNELQWVQVDFHSNTPFEQAGSSFYAYEVDLAYNKPCIASSYWTKDVICLPSNAVNRKEFTHWNAARMSAGGEYIEVDLQVPTLANNIIWKQRRYGDRITAYRCCCFTKRGWITIAEYDGPLFGQKEQWHIFDVQEITKVRIEILKTIIDKFGNDDPGIESIEVYHL